MNVREPIMTETIKQPVGVGSVVHYVSHGTPIREDGTQAYPAQCRAAIVTEVADPDPAEGHGWMERPRVGLCVLNPNGHLFTQNVAHGPAGLPEDEGFTDLCDNDTHEGGTWHWPAQVREVQP